jgi:cellulose synthase/poly-beta-1,6-N-acetylglucosamine synthase-like glycosyltransferase
VTYSLIITAWKEAATVAQNLEFVLTPENGNYLPDMEIVLVTPDDETANAAQNIIDKTGFKNFVCIRDPHKGKPTALNMALDQVKGTILIFTDGDVLLAKDALQEVIKPFSNSSIACVTGRPVSSDSKNNLFGYWGHLLADVAHHKRTNIFDNGEYYFVSGYLYAMRKIEGFKFPSDILIDDAWATIKIVQLGHRIAYAPKAMVYVKYATNFSDWIRQKRRSLGGHNQLESYKEATNIGNRKFSDELSYFMFPLKYSTNIKEFMYSLLLYPGRMYLWIVIWIQRKVLKRSFEKTWVRIESTK